MRVVKRQNGSTRSLFGLIPARGLDRDLRRTLLLDDDLGLVVVPGVPGDAAIVDEARTARSLEQGLTLVFGRGDADERARESTT